MFQAEVGHVITQAEQEVVVAVVGRAKQQAGLLHQIAIALPHLQRRLEGARAVRCDVHLHGRILPRVEGNNFQIFSSNNGGIHQRVKRNRAEMNFISRL